MSDKALMEVYDDNSTAFERAMTKVINDLSALITDYVRVPGVGPKAPVKAGKG